MNNNSVTITLNARDDASRVVSNLTNNIEGGLASAFGKAAFSANMMTEVVKVGIGAITGLVGKLKDGLTQAVGIQSENISTAGNIMKLTGQNYAQATEFIDEFSIKMSNVAAALPGATSDYVNLGKALFDDVIPAFKDLNGNVNLTALKKEMEEVATLGTLLAQSANVNTAGASSAISKFLGGAAGKGELMQLDFFQKNTTFRNTLFEEVEKLGGDVKDLTTKQRLEIFKKAASIPKEVLEAQSKSLAGLAAGFQSSLFDPQSGLFGFMRDLNEKAKGSQSVLAALNVGLDLLVGEGGLLSSVSTTLKALGIEFGDPMVALRSGILFFNAKIKYLNDALKSFSGFNPFAGMDKGQFKTASQGNISKLTNDLKFLFDKLFNFKGIGEKLGGLVNGGLDFLKGMNWSAVFSTFGQKLGEVVNEALNFINKLDFTKIGDTLLSITGGLFIGLGKFLSTLDWGATMIALGKLLGLAILGTIAVAGAMLIAPIVAGIGLLGAGIAAAVVGISAVIAANWEGVKSAAMGFVTFVADKWTQLTSFVGKVWGGITSSVMNLFAGIQSKFNELLSKIPGLGGEAQVAQPSGIGNLAGSVVPNAATGANLGLLEAAMRERKASPSGSGLVVANSTETILNAAQARQLAGSLGNRGGVSIGSINITAPTANPEELAALVTNSIMRQFGSFNQGYVPAAI